MLKLVTATLTTKGRITLPKLVRQVLQVRGDTGERISFLINEGERRVVVTGRRRTS